MEHQLFAQIRNQPEEVSIFHMCTTWSNIWYLVWQPSVPSHVGNGITAWIECDVVQAGICWFIRQAAQGKTVVYAGAIKQVKALAQQLRCAAYSRETVDKPGVLNQFIDGQSQVIAATSALGMGVDIPDIRLVIHMGTPYTLLDHAQESGQAGCDRQPSIAVIIQPMRWDMPPVWMEDTPGHKLQQMQRYMDGQCQWQMLDQHLDRHH
ncbi:hypothetical protein H4217_001560 [Coemansia sp. RSA 1939]|nr:hypothetical protein H4217_001560 [Coemansia sp. RSA 1939]